MYGDRYSPEGVRALAAVYWQVLLVIAFVVLVLVIGYAELRLVGILKSLAQPLDTKIPSAALSRSDLDAALAAFQSRQDSYDTLRKSRATAITDPYR